MAVLADDDSVQHGQVNDILIGRFRVLAFNDTSVELEELPDGTHTTLHVGTVVRSVGTND